LDCVAASSTTTVGQTRRRHDGRSCSVGPQALHPSAAVSPRSWNPCVAPRTGGPRAGQLEHIDGDEYSALDHERGLVVGRVDAPTARC
jgi:hypothetical protein